MNHKERKEKDSQIGFKSSILRSSLCKSRKNNTEVDDAQYIDVVMPM